MGLVETHRQVKKSIVAIVPRHIPLTGPDYKRPSVPPIIGTGLIVGDGLIATNHHVIQIFETLPRPPDTPKDTWPAAVLIFHEIPGHGIAQVPLEILGAFIIQNIHVKGHYYGPTRPDLGFVHVKASGLPSIPINPDATVLQEGKEVATAGFPMGAEMLTAPGWLHQLTPTLQRGIISAILPFPCDTPHAFAINVMVQGGASGSPVFLPEDFAAIGILYAGLNDFGKTEAGNPYLLPTNISYVVPGHFIVHCLELISRDPNLGLPQDVKSLQEILEAAEFEVIEDGPQKEQALRPTIRKTPGRIPAEGTVQLVEPKKEGTV